MTHIIRTISGNNAVRARWVMIITQLLMIAILLWFRDIVWNFKLAGIEHFLTWAVSLLLLFIAIDLGTHGL